ncbi:Spo0E family sporulation regulatory protein-aspartic acid phosphatase [Radiobacillus sp. PE A8.2]|uniref:Spo0E family sporulation regulatory protein-aspartic acid phosphatase n=1 Tax=Radiobacillus sp. PE A8.2 TaxID=3380349 RepID=UPI00388E9D4A
MDRNLYLLTKIETCRKEMVGLYNTYHDLTSDAVIAVSSKLDYWLNQYDNADK